VPRSQRGFSRVPQRRRKGWEEGVGQNTLQTPLTASGSAIASAAISVLVDGLTLLRLRGALTIYVSGPTADDGFTYNFGIGITTVAAITAGVGSVPTPTTEQDWDQWIFWHTGSLKTINATAGDLGINAVGMYERVPIDTKAMRKLNEDSAIYAVIEVVETGMSVFNWHLDSRILVALP